MKKFLILREPIELEIAQIVEVRDKFGKHHERMIVLDNDIGEVQAYEGNGREFQVGDLVRYYVDTDNFRLFDKTQIPANSRLLEIVTA
jgi:hypothetical protein